MTPLTETAMRILESRDVVKLLRAEVERTGSVSAWARKMGLDRTIVSKVLSNARPVPPSIITALKLRTAIVDDKT